MSLISGKMTRIPLCAFIVLFVVSHVRSDAIADRERNTSALIESRGFDSETHEITTEDGYVLTVFRIVNPYMKELKRELKKHVLMMHGLLGSSAGWLINDDGPFANATLEVIDDTISEEDLAANATKVGNNIGFELAMRGYDVWLGNCRGNVYSRGHKTLDIKAKDKKYWQFTFDEHAKYDLPATIDYIIATTSTKSIGYVGHSQGTMIMFALLSEETKYNNVINPFIALAPVTTVSFIKSPVRYLANGFLLNFTQWSGGPFLASNTVMKLLATGCPSQLSFICSNLLFVMAGFNKEQFNERRSAAVLSHMPSGTSAYNIIHYARNYKAKKFQKFDFGTKKDNQIKYGEDAPPEYPIEKIACPSIALMHSDNDYLASPEDVALLKERLTVPLLDDYRVPLTKWNHLDLWRIRFSNLHMKEMILGRMSKMI